jgi:hypothetical protein
MITSLLIAGTAYELYSHHRKNRRFLEAKVVRDE